MVDFCRRTLSTTLFNVHREPLFTRAILGLKFKNSQILFYFFIKKKPKSVSYFRAVGLLFFRLLKKES